MNPDAVVFLRVAETLALDAVDVERHAVVDISHRFTDGANPSDHAVDIVRTTTEEIDVPAGAIQIAGPDGEEHSALESEVVLLNRFCEAVQQPLDEVAREDQLHVDSTLQRDPLQPCED